MLPRLSGTMNTAALDAFSILLVLVHFSVFAYFIWNILVSIALERESELMLFAEGVLCDCVD